MCKYVCIRTNVLYCFALPAFLWSEIQSSGQQVENAPQIKRQNVLVSALLKRFSGVFHYSVNMGLKF